MLNCNPWKNSVSQHYVRSITIYFYFYCIFPPKKSGKEPWEQGCVYLFQQQKQIDSDHWAASTFMPIAYSILPISIPELLLLSTFKSEENYYDLNVEERRCPGTYVNPLISVHLLLSAPCNNVRKMMLTFCRELVL